jgi:hypothetical protein
LVFLAESHDVSFDSATVARLAARIIYEMCCRFFGTLFNSAGWRTQDRQSISEIHTGGCGGLARVRSLRAVALGLVLTGSLATPTTAASAPAATSRPVVHGGDVSWPNCPKGEGIPSRRSEGEPMPTAAARFVIVGVTNGPGFHANPCLGRELGWVRRHHRRLGGYALTTYPTAGQIRRYARTGPFTGRGTRAALRNAGYAEGRFNIVVMGRAHMLVPMIWVDVEPYPAAPWSASIQHNRAVVVGAMRAYRDAGFAVGLYSNPNGWPEVVGNWRLPVVPTWSTVGYRGEKKARHSCAAGPSGGPTWIAQWWVGHRDLDLTCPYAPAKRAMFGAR